MLRQKLSSVISQEYAASGGVKPLADILNSADRSTERNVLDRLSELDDELAEEVEPSTVVLVAHGGMIAGVVCGLLGLPIEAWPAIGGLGNCRWAALGRRADHPRWRLVGYNVGAEA